MPPTVPTNNPGRIINSGNVKTSPKPPLPRTAIIVWGPCHIASRPTAPTMLKKPPMAAVGPPQLCLQPRSGNAKQRRIHPQPGVRFPGRLTQQLGFGNSTAGQTNPARSWKRLPHQTELPRDELDATRILAPGSRTTSPLVVARKPDECSLDTLPGDRRK